MNHATTATAITSAVLCSMAEKPGTTLANPYNPAIRTAFSTVLRAMLRTVVHRPSRGHSKRSFPFIEHSVPRAAAGVKLGPLPGLVPAACAILRLTSHRMECSVDFPQFLWIFAENPRKMAKTHVMLLAFSVRNFKSIRDLQTLSLEARADDHLEVGNVFESGRRRILKSAAIYGPNASGKSNLIRAMQWMRYYVFNSSKATQAGEPIPVEPFRFSTLTENAPSYFETEFLLDGFVFRYGFTVSALRVESEWLFRKSSTARPAKLFTRE
ncbi:MAG: hypothetical protein EOP86_25870, partial [Verrucomicrobiaceae bacterium]